MKKEEKIELEKVREKRDRKRLRIFCFRHVLKTVSALQIDKKKEKKKKERRTLRHYTQKFKCKCTLPLGDADELLSFQSEIKTVF